MKDYLTGIPQVLLIGLVLTLGMVGYEFVTWKQFFAVFAIFAVVLSYFFVRELKRRQ
jgi:membrane protein implicated in regulation of membrane protease activity